MTESLPKITKEFCLQKNIIFLPETREEAIFIQKALFAMGYIWGDGQRDVDYVDEILHRGLALIDGSMYTRGKDDNRRYFVCKSSQLGGGKAYMSQSEQASLREEFNELAELVRKMSKKVDAMYDEVMPKRLDKPGTGKSDPKL